jgi:hypothetical protein
MATNISVYDLLNYPDNNKTITLDLKSVVGLGYGGDERWVVQSFSSATASGSSAIQDVFADSIKIGWCKSSGIPSGPYAITHAAKCIKVAIDESISGGVDITLPPGEIAKSGDEVAADIQEALRNTTLTGLAKAGNLSYLNACCYYENRKFIITSGSMAKVFSGTGRSSVRVAAASSLDASVLLGFDITTSSEELDSTTINESYVYPSGVVANTTVNLASVADISVGDCLAFKKLDGTYLYRYVDSKGASDVVVNTAITAAAGTRVQVMRFQDADAEPPSFYTDIDSAVRHIIAGLTNQINFA